MQWGSLRGRRFNGAVISRPRRGTLLLEVIERALQLQRSRDLSTTERQSMALRACSTARSLQRSRDLSTTER